LILTKGAVAASMGKKSWKSLMTATQMVPKFFAATSQIDDLYESYMNAAMCADRILQLLNARPAVRGGNTRLNPADVHGEIHFKDVSFSYLPGTQILTSLSLDVSPGQTVGIVGATGAGKTTLFKLMLRFYDIDAGTISIDGTSISAFPLQDLRRAVAFVSQDAYLFDGTVYENILYGKPDASRDEVVEAARVAEAHEFIVRLPLGYDSPVGERGQRLSTGQRQRVSIARAILKDAPILVLDEATASVDNETEAAIHRSIERIAVGRSMVVIAHRLSTVRNAARIYVIDNGSVAEQGTHDELLAMRGLYASLWNVQTGSRKALN
jgi:ATP-binding cassette subfamily B protein